jgi:ABC-type oligopeptide transport system substrate-binding subunit
MKLNRNVKRMRRLAILTLSILTASGLTGCASSKLQPVYVLNGAHVKVLPRAEWGEATNTTAKAVYRVTDVWLEKVRRLELAESAE